MTTGGLESPLTVRTKRCGSLSRPVSSLTKTSTEWGPTSARVGDQVITPVFRSMPMPAGPSARKYSRIGVYTIEVSGSYASTS
ncbi:MAG: hypothetical protein H6674_10580 [Dehalococcoidia bacterium]|nr:hypothetical protein [Dehalococcoidia bacterium]